MMVLRGLGALILSAGAALAAEPVKHIPVFVEPYYNAGRTPGEKPRVEVAKRLDALLASSKREDILAVADSIKADPATITPMTMMVLAVRLYDVGERDEAVFWFYAAKDRMMIISEVAVPKSGQLAQALDATMSFSRLAGPTINGYAFCELKNQQAIRARALDWVEANPYQVMFMPQLQARGENRDALAKAGMRLARDNAGKERAYFEDAKTREDYYATRKKNEADAKYCWK